MDYRVILSPAALRDLGAIARYIAQDNPAAARKVGLDLVAMAQSLSRLPYRGGETAGRTGRRKLVSRPYLIFYRIDEPQRTVYVIRFWHAKRNPKIWWSG